MTRDAATAICPSDSSTSVHEWLASGTDRLGQSWAGRRVTVVGLGRSGPAAAQLLCRAGAHVRATEARDTDALRAARETLLACGVHEVELGRHTQRLMTGTETVVVSPGVPESSHPMQWAQEHQVPIVSEIELAYFFCPSPVIAVTGTNGKSTVVTLIAAVLNAAGRHAVACGNLGIPFSSVLEQLTSQSIAVVEVSSFQLLGCEQFRPRIGVLLNIGTNHLDRHVELEAYLASKARLFQRQTPEDWAVLNGADPRIAAVGERLHAQRAWFGQNLSNGPALQLAPQTLSALTSSAQAVLQVGRLVGIPDPLTWQILRTFRGLEHRLEEVATVRGVRFVNDSKSTTPDSLLYALAQTRGDLVVIAGGRDKGMDFSPLTEALHTERVKGIVLIGESRARLRALFNGSPPVRESNTLEDAVNTAVALAQPGTTVLFSPACASFDMFRDFEDRGLAFKTVVRACANRSGVS